MEKLKYLSLFSGIGAFEMALKNIGVDYELMGFSEIDKYAIKSYCAIHNVNEKLNLGDITKINIEELPKNIDIITHGSPCQSFSIAGLQHGGDKGSDTRSSLMWNTVEIVKHCKPKYVIWENVKNVLSKKHIHNFNEYLDELKQLGYENYYKVLNAKDYGIPQNRERVFVVSVLDGVGFEFPNSIKLEKTLGDVLDKYVDEKYYINYNKTIPQWDFSKDIIGRLNIGSYDLNNRVYGLDSCGFTLRAKKSDQKILTIDRKLRYLTPTECFRLMGVSEVYINKIQEIGISNNQQYKLAGNSIVVNVLEKIFENLFLEIDKNQTPS